MAFWDRKPKVEPDMPKAKSSARPGVGSDPAPYLPDNVRNWAETPHESKASQDARLDKYPRYRAWRLGVPERLELVQDRQYRDTKYGVATTDDNHPERKYVDDPYIVNPPQPIRRRLTPSTFRELNESVQRFGGFSQHMNGDGADGTLASNIRPYPIGGMRPVIRRRNTYRLEPPPIDMNQVDLPPSGTRFEVPDTATISRGPAPGLRGIKILR